jgi:Fur family ferric uptake transcriptional regulator
MRASSVDQVILDVLEKEHTHLTSLQVYNEIRERLPAVNQSTIYRSLERLARNGIISVSDMGTGAAVYELPSQGVHHHLVCQKCGLSIKMEDEDVREFFDDIQDKYRFRIVTNHLILFGVCEGCQTSNALN